jgi:hypothetical protein
LTRIAPEKGLFRLDVVRRFANGHLVAEIGCGAGGGIDAHLAHGADDHQVGNSA